MLAGNPDIDLILGLNDSMALGAYNVINGKDQYKNVYVAASADGQKEALALIKKGGCEGRYISTGLNSPSLAAEEALKISVDVATGKTKPSRLPEGVLHQSRRHRLRQHRRVLRPQQRLLIQGRQPGHRRSPLGWPAVPGRCAAARNPTRTMHDNLNEQLAAQRSLHLPRPRAVLPHRQCQSRTSPARTRPTDLPQLPRPDSLPGMGDQHWRRRRHLGRPQRGRASEPPPAPALRQEPSNRPTNTPAPGCAGRAIGIPSTHRQRRSRPSTTGPPHRRSPVCAVTARPIVLFVGDDASSTQIAGSLLRRLVGNRVEIHTAGAQPPNPGGREDQMLVMMGLNPAYEERLSIARSPPQTG